MVRENGRIARLFFRVSAYYIGRGMGWIALRQVADRSVAGKVEVRGERQRERSPVSKAKKKEKKRRRPVF